MTTICCGLASVALDPTSLLAHRGDFVYPIYGLTAADESFIDLGDGSLTDWPQFCQTSYLTGIDFQPNGASGGTYDPLDLEFQVLMAWSPRTNRIYVGAQRIDDVHVNGLDRSVASSRNIYLHDSVELVIDGDHSGGVYVPHQSLQRIAADLVHRAPLTSSQTSFATGRTSPSRSWRKYKRHCQRALSPTSCGATSLF